MPVYSDTPHIRRMGEASGPKSPDVFPRCSTGQCMGGVILHVRSPGFPSALIFVLLSYSTMCTGR